MTGVKWDRVTSWDYINNSEGFIVGVLKRLLSETPNGLKEPSILSSREPMHPHNRDSAQRLQPK